MLKSHMDAQEVHLVAISKIPANSGHPLHKGTPREAFIREFLESHLPSDVAIGTGEIIDASSKPGQIRNQFDIVIYRKSFPKLDFGGGVSGFLIESVIATIEVKSVLSQAAVDQSIGAAINAKALISNAVTSFHTGYIPPKILNYVVAYDGPAAMQTAYNWIVQAHLRQGIQIAALPQNEDARNATAAPSIDGMFVLGRGFVYFDNVPTGFAHPSARSNNPNLKWVFADTSSGNLLLLFMFLQGATANMEARWLNTIPYLSSFNVAPQFGVV